MKKDTMYLYNNIKICALHFEDSQFMNTEKKRLVWNAVPTLFDVPNKPPTITLKRKLPNRCTVPPKKKQKARRSRSVGVGGESSAAAHEKSSVKKEPASDCSESTSATAEQVCSGIASKVEERSEREEISSEEHGHQVCERITVKEEPEAECEDNSSEEWRRQACETITVKVEPVAEYEDNSSEEWRKQEPEYIEVKGEPLEADEATDSGGTQWDALSPW